MIAGLKKTDTISTVNTHDADIKEDAGNAFREKGKKEKIWLVGLRKIIFYVTHKIVLLIIYT